MANPELGGKQICPTCQSKFYDLKRRPALCPKCGASFDPEEAVKVRRVRSRGATPDYEDVPEKEAVAKPAPDEETEGFEDEVEDTPEIDQAADAEPLETDDEDADPTAPPAAPDNDIGVDFEEETTEDEAEGVPFLEEEDEDFPEEEIEGLPDPDEEH